MGLECPIEVWEWLRFLGLVLKRTHYEGRHTCGWFGDAVESVDEGDEQAFVAGV